MSRDTGEPTSRQRREMLELLSEHEQRVAAAHEQQAATSCHFDEDDGVDQPWDRNSYGDVRNMRAFDRHMSQVGEEDQSVPGWDSGA